MTKRSLALAACVWAIAAAVGLARVPQETAWRERALASFDAAWETIHTTYYDPTFGGLDWTAVARELRPKVASAKTESDARDVIEEMLGKLGQSHFDLLRREATNDGPRGEAGAPFEVRVVDDAVLVVGQVGDAPLPSGPRPGDRLLSIDDVEMKAVIGAATGRGPMRQFNAWRAVYREMSGADQSRMRLRWIRPDGTAGAAEVMRVVEEGTPVAFGNLPPMRARVRGEEIRAAGGRRVGVIAFNVWLPIINQPFETELNRFRSHDGLVIDLRGNPGGVADMIRGIAGHVLDEPKVIGRMQMRAASLEFRANPRRSTTEGARVTPFSGPVAILVDGLTASTSECFAGGLQSLGRARVFGTTSVGAALPAATRVLPNGDILMHVVGDFVTSTGRRLEGGGVEPDEVVPLVPAELAAGRDALFHAVRWIERQAK